DRLTRSRSANFRAMRKLNFLFPGPVEKFGTTVGARPPVPVPEWVAIRPARGETIDKRGARLAGSECRDSGEVPPIEYHPGGRVGNLLGGRSKDYAADKSLALVEVRQGVLKLLVLGI